MLKSYKEIIFFFFLSLLANPLQSSCLDDYFLLYEKYPKCLGEKGNYRNYEIEILLDPIKMRECEQIQKARLIKKGWDEKKAAVAAKVGIISEDPYWIFIRDAVLFPSGTLGTYNRLIIKPSLTGNTGVGVLPILPDGKVLLVLNYRHATRSWQVELPRGGRDLNETDEMAARRELREETGAVVKTIDFLGVMQPDSGACSAEVTLHLAHIETIGNSNHEVSEAIYKTIFLTKQELEKALVDGFIEVEILGKKKKANLKDSFLAFAYLQAKLRDYF